MTHGHEQEDDDEPFTEKYPRLLAKFEECLADGERLTCALEVRKTIHPRRPPSLAAPSRTTVARVIAVLFWGGSMEIVVAALKGREYRQCC